MDHSSEAVLNAPNLLGRGLVLLSAGRLARETAVGGELCNIAASCAGFMGVSASWAMEGELHGSTRAASTSQSTSLRLLRPTPTSSKHTGGVHPQILTHTHFPLCFARWPSSPRTRIEPRKTSATTNGKAASQRQATVAPITPPLSYTRTHTHKTETEREREKTKGKVFCQAKDECFRSLLGFGKADCMLELFDSNLWPR